MSALSLALIIALATVLIAEFVNGWTDAPNAIATVVATGVMSPSSAILMAVIMNTVGAMSGTAVAKTVGQGIVVPAALTLPAITAAMLSIIAWGTFAARVGMPVSKSHALSRGPCGCWLRGRRLERAAMGRLAESASPAWPCRSALARWQRCYSGLLIIRLSGASKPGRSKPSVRSPVDLVGVLHGLQPRPQ